MFFLKPIRKKKFIIKKEFLSGRKFIIEREFLSGKKFISEREILSGRKYISGGRELLISLGHSCRAPIQYT